MTMSLPARQIHSSARSCELRDLLQAVFVSELIVPSRCVWLVSPWISDIPVIDNESNSFGQLAPDWPRGRITLCRLVAHMLESGSTVHIATRDVDHNFGFFAALEGIRSPQLHLHVSNELHEKGLLSDHYYLSGSMNFTFSGISLNEEVVHFITDPADVARNRVMMAQRWGGERP